VVFRIRIGVELDYIRRYPDLSAACDTQTTAIRRTKPRCFSELYELLFAHLLQAHTQRVNVQFVKSGRWSLAPHGAAILARDMPEAQEPAGRVMS
jgi:hypothetical protein